MVLTVVYDAMVLVSSVVVGVWFCLRDMVQAFLCNVCPHLIMFFLNVFAPKHHPRLSSPTLMEMKNGV